MIYLLFNNFYSNINFNKTFINSKISLAEILQTLTFILGNFLWLDIFLGSNKWN